MSICRKVGTNQTEIRMGDKIMFFSYETIVGLRIGEEVYYTEKKFSKTTSTHLNKWLASVYPLAAKPVCQEELERLATLATS